MLDHHFAHTSSVSCRFSDGGLGQRRRLAAPRRCVAPRGARGPRAPSSSARSPRTPGTISTSSAADGIAAALDRLAHRVEQDVAGGAQVAADDDALGVEQVARGWPARWPMWRPGVGDGALAARVAVGGAARARARASGPRRGWRAAARERRARRRTSRGSRGCRSGRSGRSRRSWCGRSRRRCRRRRGTAGRRRPARRRCRWRPSGRRGSTRPGPRPRRARPARRGWRRCRRGPAGRGARPSRSATRTPTQPGRIAGEPTVPVEAVDRAAAARARRRARGRDRAGVARAPRRRARPRRPCPSRAVVVLGHLAPALGQDLVGEVGDRDREVALAEVDADDHARRGVAARSGPGGRPLCAAAPPGSRPPVALDDEAVVLQIGDERGHGRCATGPCAGRSRRGSPPRARAARERPARG